MINPGIQSRVSASIAACCLVLMPLTAADSPADPLVEVVRRVAARCESEELRHLLNNQIEEMRTKNPRNLGPVFDLLQDLRRRELIDLLADENHRTSVPGLADIADVNSLPRFYRAVSGWTFRMILGSAQDYYISMISSVNEQAAAVLGIGEVPDIELRGWTVAPNAIPKSWQIMLEKAIEKKTIDKPLEGLARQVDNLDILSRLPAARRDNQQLEAELETFCRGLRSKPLKKLLLDASSRLISRETADRQKALAMFHDVRARRVIVELLDSEDHQDRVAEKYLDVVEFDCLERLFIITYRDLPKSKEGDGKAAMKIVARNKRVDAINKQLAKMLKVDPVGMKEYTQLALKEAWLAMLTTAKEKRTLWKPVEETLERIKADMKKDAAKKDEKDLPEEKKK